MKPFILHILCDVPAKLHLVSDLLRVSPLTYGFHVVFGDPFQGDAILNKFHEEKLKDFPYGIRRLPVLQHMYPVDILTNDPDAEYYDTCGKKYSYNY